VGGWGCFEFGFEFDTYQTFTASPTRKATQKTTLSGGSTPICHFDIDEKLLAICMGVGDTETDFKV